MKNINITKKILKIAIFALFTFLIFSTPAQACKTGNCYENGIKPNNPKKCDCGSSGSNPCWWNNIRSHCRGHNPVPSDIETRYNATCTSGGTIDYYVKCTHCSNRHYSHSTSTGALDHMYPSSYSYNADQHWKSCQRPTSAGGCGGYTSAPEAHSWQGSDDWTEYGSRVTKAATCTTTGTKEHYWQKGKTCRVCGRGGTEYNTTYETLPVLTHDMGNYSKDNNSTHTASCTRCGAGHSHTEAHIPSGWLNSGRGYRYKNKCFAFQ